MSFQLRDLPWLPPAPPDLRQRLRGLGVEQAAELPRLAGFRLSPEEASSFARAMARLRAAGATWPGLSDFRLGVLSNATFDLVAEHLSAAAARHGVALAVTLPDYDQVQQQALDPASTINTAGLDGVLISVDHRWLGISGRDASEVDQATARLREVIVALRANGGAAILLQTVPTPPLPLFGSLDRRQAGTLRANVHAMNQRIVELARETGAILFDVEALAERVGTDLWFDPVQWAAFKLPFSSSVFAAYADGLGALLGAIRGKSRKCLVLDLDNTIWGGVIGDDGINNIKIGQGSAVGEAFLAVQHYALALRARGIMLAVSSKNDDATAREVFRDHPEMALREEHISVFQANWTDKASNLEAIARTLNIGIDALVFLDDNPAERAQVRAALPAVALPELPSDPSWYPWFLASAGYFEALSFSEEDRLRVESYASDAKRAAVLARTGDLGDYLKSLGMKMRAGPFDAKNRPRITQLINKTNQFNLTTRRYTEAEVTAMEDAPGVHTLQVRLGDSFGDFGMIGVAIARQPDAAEPTWMIDTWLMSCRVLGRKVEEAMLAQIVAAARAAGISRIEGLYRPTPKNGMVKDHYTKLGFSSVEERADGECVFALDVSAYEAPELPIEIE